MKKISSLPAGLEIGLEMKNHIFLINPFTSQTALVEVILILHVCGNHFKVKALTPHSPRKMLEFGAEVPAVNHPVALFSSSPAVGASAYNQTASY